MIRINVKKTLPGLSLNASFESDHAKVTAVFGKSGCGKTTLVNMIAGLVKPDEGLIQINDLVLFDSQNRVNLPPEKRKIGYVFQDGRLFPHMTVRKNLLYGARSDVQSVTGLKDVVRLLDIDPLLNRKPARLSGGEKQRVAIGRALLSNPRLLLMDEPLAALDSDRKAEIMPFIERLRDELGIPTIYVSHAMEEIIRLADLMVIMDAGKVAAVGSVEALSTNLDLQPITGQQEAGSVLTAKIISHDGDLHLSQLEIPGGSVLTVPLLHRPVGTALRIRIQARDVILSLQPPTQISTLNRLQGTITEIRKGKGPHADIMIDIGQPLWARITQKSVNDLGLMPGLNIHALVKSVAIDRQSLGTRRSAD